jgi:excisionase family DNA binding protein
VSATAEPELPRFLYAAEAARELRVHPITIARMIERGELRGAKICGRYRVPREDVEALLASLL